MARVTLQGFQCERCQHKWYPREEGDPKVCPKCKSPYWDRPRRDMNLLNRHRVKGIYAKKRELKGINL